MNSMRKLYTSKNLCFLAFLSMLVQRSNCFIVHQHETLSSTRSRLHTSAKTFCCSSGKSLNRLQTSLLLSTKSSSSSPLIETTPRVIAARVLIEKPPKKGKTNNNNNNPVTKLETNNDFHLLSSQRDKSFTRNLVSTTTRRKGQIDAVLRRVCDKYPPKCGKYTGIVTSCMRLGAAQVLFMDVKDFAAVMETVNVLKHKQFKTP